MSFFPLLFLLQILPQLRAQRFPGPPPVCIQTAEWVDEADSDGYTPLFRATIASQLELVQRLVDCGHRTEIISNDGVTPWYYAMMAQRTELMVFLMNNGANINYYHPVYRTALYYSSVTIADLNMVRWLLDLGLEPDIVDDKDYTPLWYASWGGQLDLTKDLLDHGADINRATLVDNRQRGLLWYAVVEHRYFNLAVLLINSGINIDPRDDRDWTPLMYAAVKDRMALCVELIKGGADPRFLDYHIQDYSYETMEVTYILALCKEHPTRPGCPDPTYPDVHYGKKIYIRDVLRALRHDNMVDFLEVETAKKNR